MDEIKFIADNNLGKLVKILRIIGFDTKEMEQHNHEQIVKISFHCNAEIILKDRKEVKGMATHLGILLDTTTIGCARRAASDLNPIVLLFMVAKLVFKLK